MEASIKAQLGVFICFLGAFTMGCAKMSFSPVPEPEIAAVTPPPAPAPTKTISSTEVVAYGNKQVDFLLVLDDSNSMMPELKKLAARLSTFVSSLDASNIDWQMCLTTTRGVTAAGKTTYGAPKEWNNYVPASNTPAYLLKKGTANLNTIFTSTIDKLTIGGGGSGDERAIKAAFESFANSAPSADDAHQCYRPGAAVSVIVISDEDERSVGGVPGRVKPQDSATAYQPMEAEDLPANLVAKSKSVFGQDVRFTFSSIIVKPGDAACEAEQDQAAASPSHPGYIYEEMSKLTDGGVGSICDADYSGNLNTFKDKIVNSLSHLNLECTPVPESLKVSIDGLKITDFKLNGSMLKFTYALIEGTTIDLQYDCVEGVP